MLWIFISQLFLLICFFSGFYIEKLTASFLFITLSGHGGIRAAEYVKKNLFSNLISHPKFISDTKSAICMLSPTAYF